MLKQSFYKYPNRDPKSNIPMEIGGETYTKYVEKYGDPRIKSPKTGRKIKVNKTEYKNLLKEGYSEQELLYGLIDDYPTLPSHLIDSMVEHVKPSTKRLINKE